MNLKLRSALLFGLIVMVLLSVAFGIIYVQSAWFREDDFQLRLRQKALTTYKLLVEQNQIDSTLLQVIDRTSINKLYDERVLIFDKNQQLIYSSPGEQKITFTPELLNKIKQKKYLEFSEGDREAVGLFINDEGAEGIAIASANDLYGKRKLKNLFFILSVCWIGSIFITSLVSYFYVRHIFRPIVILNKNIQEITESNLQQRVKTNPANNELAQLASNFNKMLDRLQQSFEVQKNFLQYASHELRTPLSNLLLQTEAALGKKMSEDEYRSILLSIHDDQKYLVDMVNSILLLSKYEQPTLSKAFQPARVDELLFETAEEIRGYHPEYIIHIDFSSIPSTEKDLTASRIPGLIKVVFTNLIRNACIYSTDQTVKVVITPGPSQIIINFYNNGPAIPTEERNKLFMPFFRGSNVSQKRGHGLGLSISKRIIDVHKGQLFYSTTKNGLNCFTIILLNI